LVRREKMKLKSLFVFLTVCLMVSIASAAIPTTYWDGSNSNWDDRDGTSNWVDQSSQPTRRPDGTTDLKLGGIADYGNPKNNPGGTVTLDSVEQWATIYSNNMRVMGGATLNITPTGRLEGPGWLRVGQGGDKGTGTINQTGGKLKLIWCAADGPSPGRYQSRLVMGDSQDTGGLTKGYYNISGGTLTHGILPEDEVSVSEGRIVVGDRGGTGTLKVIGTGKVVDDTTPVIAPININMGMLYVGANYMSAAYRTATGTLEYVLEAGDEGYEVSPIHINPTSASIAVSNGGYCVDIDGAGAAGTANLVVTSAGAAGGVILLVDNKSTTAVKGVFDTLNGVAGAAEGATTVVGGLTYTLTYLYCAGTDGLHNDIALIPEPATLVLLSLGLIAIRRKK
jgi:hypothetical protein